MEWVTIVSFWETLTTFVFGIELYHYRNYKRTLPQKSTLLIPGCWDTGSATKEAVMSYWIALLIKDMVN